MIELNQEEILNLFIDKMEKLGAKTKSHVVNPADPTQVDILEVDVGMEYGLFLNPLPKAWEPKPEIVKVKVVASFGREVTIGSESAYLDGKWYRPTENFFKVFKRVLIEGICPEELSFEEPHYPGYDHACGYHD